MGSHTLQQWKRYTFDELKELFETTMKNVNTFVPMETEDRGRASKAAEAELDHEVLRDKRLIKLQDQFKNNQMKRKKIVTRGFTTDDDGSSSGRSLFFDRNDLVMLWILVKERFSSTEPADDKERTLWVKLKRLFEPKTDDTLWKLQRYMHNPLKWRLYDTCGVHHVSIERGTNIFMLVKKEYPLSKGVLTLMLVNKLLVEQHLEMANELLRKIFIQANRPRQ
ncbi:hypothetical protein Tco_0848270 [Tanacetum coccineum]